MQKVDGERNFENFPAQNLHLTHTAYRIAVETCFSNAIQVAKKTKYAEKRQHSVTLDLTRGGSQKWKSNFPMHKRKRESTMRQLVENPVSGSEKKLSRAASGASSTYKLHCWLLEM